MREVNKSINNMKSKLVKLKALNRPVTAFIIFENEEGINRAINYKETVESDI